MIMNNNLFKTLLIPAVACLLGACAESMDPDMETSVNSGAIRFAGPAVTRAAIDDAGGMLTNGNSFSVWGNYTAVTGGTGTATSLFDAEKVTYVSGMWGYEGTRYWLPGNTYDFYALYPSVETLGDAVSVDCTDGTFTVNGFDATKGYDLMTAKNTGIETEAGKAPEAVGFNFEHLLARVEFLGRIDPATAKLINGFTVTVTEASLYGIPARGSYGSNGSWTAADGSTTSASQPFVQLQSTGGVSLSAETPTPILGQDAERKGNCLPLPGAVTDAYFHVKYTSGTAGNTREHETTVPIASLGVLEWQAGRSYRYTFTVADEDHILFSKPTVNAWQDATGGIIVVE